MGCYCIAGVVQCPESIINPSRSWATSTGVHSSIWLTMRSDPTSASGHVLVHTSYGWQSTLRVKSRNLVRLGQAGAKVQARLGYRMSSASAWLVQRCVSHHASTVCDWCIMLQEFILKVVATPHITMLFAWRQVNTRLIEQNTIYINTTLPWI